MKNYYFDKHILVNAVGSSVGAQPKYYSSGYWYKEDNLGKEGLSEYLVSIILSCSNIDDYVEYEQCIINDKPGCRCKSFTKVGEFFLSFQKMFDMLFGGELEGKLATFDSSGERIDFVKCMVLQYTGLDISKYLSDVLSLDMVTLNPDRHMNNLGIIADINDGSSFRLAPIFDNGAALCSDFNRFPPDRTIDELKNMVIGRPFSSNLELQAATAGISLKLDYDKLYQLLNNEPDSKAKRILLSQLDSYSDLLKVSQINKDDNSIRDKNSNIHRTIHR